LQVFKLLLAHLGGVFDRHCARHVVLCRLCLRLCHGDLQAHLLGVLHQGQCVADGLRRGVAGGLRLGQLRFGHGDLARAGARFRLGQPRFGHHDGCPGSFDPGVEQRRVQLDDCVAGGYGVSLAHRDGGDAAAPFAGHQHLVGADDARGFQRFAAGRLRL